MHSSTSYRAVPWRRDLLRHGIKVCLGGDHEGHVRRPATRPPAPRGRHCQLPALRVFRQPDRLVGLGARGPAKCRRNGGKFRLHFLPPKLWNSIVSPHTNINAAGENTMIPGNSCRDCWAMTGGAYTLFCCVTFKSAQSPAQYMM